MRTTLTVLPLMIVLVVCATAFKCGGSNDGGDDPGLFTGKLAQDNKAASPKGVTVYAKNKITPEQLAAIDKGLDKGFYIAESEPNNYKGFMRHSSYTVWLGIRSNKCTNPAMVTAAYQSAWDQHPIYDKDPRPGHTLLCFAGMMIRPGLSGSPNGTGTPGMLVVGDISTLENVVWFESEHNTLFECDRPLYSQTFGQHNHPILGYGPQAMQQGTLSQYVEGIATADDDGSLWSGGNSVLSIRKGDRIGFLMTR